MSDYFKQLQGEQLSSVTFLQGYVQLHFDGPGINVFTPISVETGETAARSGDVRFRDALCGQIAKLVKEVSLEVDEALTLVFTDGSQISISLRPDDYSGPEAAVAHGFKNATMIVL